MNYSIRHCAFVISALLIGVSAIDLHTPAQAGGPIDQDAAIGAGADKIAEAGQRNIDAGRTQTLARAALTQCYTYNNQKACSQLPRIKRALANWCQQKYSGSCTLLQTVSDFESLK
jgi:hypothetical protein